MKNQKGGNHMKSPNVVAARLSQMASLSDWPSGTRAGWSAATGLLLSICFLAGHDAVAGTTVAGSFVGQLSVNESGAATYQVAIPVPPGVNGLQPQLALVYNSQAPNGLAGVGWTLSGLSAITRCPRTKAQDGVRGTVDFSLNDRFCLDGQRLILVKGAHGKPGSEYRTEVDSFSRITAVKSAGEGPASFVVESKSGIKSSYGEAGNAALRTNRAGPDTNATVATWALSSMTDKSGNSLSISYDVDTANGGQYPKQIKYGTRAGASIQPHLVTLGYEPRPDVVTTYHAGSMSRVVKRLVSVATQASSASGTTDVQLTLLSYRAPSGATHRSLLGSIQRCDGASANCLAPLNFTWLDRDLSSSLLGNELGEISGVVDWGYLAGRAWVDVNGDGRSDYCRVVDKPAVGVVRGSTGIKQLKCSLSPITVNPKFLTGGADAPETNFIVADVQDAGYDPSRAWVDINGDGRADYCRIVNTPSVGQEVVCNLSSGTGFGPDIKSGLIDAGYDEGRAWVDVDGDGRADFCRVTASNGVGGILVCTLSTATGPNGPVYRSAPLDAGYKEGRAWVDVNGDGRPDYCRVVEPTTPNNNNRRNIRCALFTGSGFDDGSFVGQDVDAGYAEGREWVDLNGDGLADYCRVITRNGEQGQLLCTLSTGVGMDTAHEIRSGLLDAGATDGGRAWVDANGDGLADFCRIVRPNVDSRMAYLQCSLFDGTNFIESAKHGPTDFGYPDARAWVDVNGDGKADFCRRVGDTNKSTSYVQCTRSMSFGDLLSQVASPGGATVEVDYQSLSADGGVYQKDAGNNSALYPVIDIQSPVYVVSAARRSNGLGGTLATTYAYGGQKGELGSGRGALGFRWMSSQEVATGVETFTEFKQVWPFTGMPVVTETRIAGQGNAGVLKRTVQAYGCLDPMTAKPCVGSPGNTYFPYLAQSKEASWDLGGAVFPSMTRTYTYGPDPTDASKVYGDPAVVTVSLSDGSSKTVRNDYLAADTATGKWLLGRLRRATATSTAPDSGPGSAQGDWTTPTLQISRQPNPMKSGQSYVVTWATSGATEVAYDCTAANGGFVGRGVLAANGTVKGVADAKWIGNPSSCIWAASGPGGVKTAMETLVTLRSPAPTITVIRNPAPMVAGLTYEARWTTTDATSVTYDCTAGGSGYRGNGTLATQGIVSGVADKAWVGFDSICNWKAIGPGGTAAKVDILTTISVAPTVSISRDPPVMVPGAPYTLTYESTSADAITYNCVAAGEGYVGSGILLSTSGVVTGVALKAWSGYPSVCTYVATGAGGSQSVTEVMTTVDATVPKPTISVVRTPPEMVAGQPYTATWSNTNTTSMAYDCTAPGGGYSGQGNLAPNSSVSGTALAAWVGSPSTCTYTATGPGGISTYTEELRTVLPPLPTLSFTRSPSTMVAGEPYSLRWTTANATSLAYNCTATAPGYSGSGTLALNSSLNDTALAVWVGYPSTCTYTATGPGGSRSFVETLTTVHPVPTISVMRSPTQIRVGQPYVFYWSTSNATSVSYDCSASGSGYVGSGTLPAIEGSVSGIGAAEWVGFPSNCTYTARGPGGIATTSETLVTTP